MNKKLLHTLCIILLAGVIGYLFYSSCSEGLSVPQGPQGPARCGVDLPSCSGQDVRCINGYCRSDVAATLPSFSDISMTPPTAY